MRLSRPGSIIAAAAIAVGAMTLTATAANATPISEGTIKSECKSAGGTYVSTNRGGTRFSACHYKDIKGNKNADFYADGEYYGTTPQ